MTRILIAMLTAAGLAGCVGYVPAGPVGYGPAYAPAYGASVYIQGSNGYPGYYRRGYGDQDRDGIPNRVDRDRDGDGVPNRMDRSPNNPNRR